MTAQLEYVTYILTSPESAITPYVNISTIVTSITSILIAILALYFTKSQISKHDLHNRLTVRPFLNDSTTINNGEHTYSFSIQNKGMGPAIIREAAIYVNGKQMTGDDPLEAAIGLICTGKPILTFGHETVAIGSYISPNEKIDIATIQTKPEYSLEQLKTEITNSAYILVRYESIYGESFNYDSRV